MRSLYRETELAAQVINILQAELQAKDNALGHFALAWQAAMEFDAVQDATVAGMYNYGNQNLMGLISAWEFSEAQHLIIEMLAGMLADPAYLLYWCFEVWGKSNLSPEFMDLLSQGYLALSAQNPPPSGDARDFDFLANQQQKLDNSYFTPKPAVPLPPIPANSNAGVSLQDIRDRFANGTVGDRLVAMRQLDAMGVNGLRQMFA